VLYSHINATAGASVQDVAIAACTRLLHHYQFVVLLVQYFLFLLRLSPLVHQRNVLAGAGGLLAARQPMRRCTQPC
jgi:hypothetical protein